MRCRPPPAQSHTIRRDGAASIADSADPDGRRGDHRARVRRAPDSLHGGPLALLRFMRANHMLSRAYLHLLARFCA